MLRASIESVGGEVDLAGIAAGSDSEHSPVRGAAALTAFVDAALASDREADPVTLVRARTRVREELGSEALVDAAAVIGNFERMVRIADGTGIPLDAPVLVATETIRGELGIDAFESGRAPTTVRAWQRTLGRLLEPLIRFALRRRGGRSRHEAERS
jgi:hypothetical protein